MRSLPLYLYITTLVAALLVVPVGSAANAPSAQADGEGANVWGGDHVRIELHKTGADLDFDCATGTIDQPLALPSEGKFQVRGTYTQERGGPVKKDGNKAVPATYVGTVKNGTMHLQIVLQDNNATVGTYDLVRGQLGHVFKCR